MSPEGPSYNSSRVQRAHRINSIETSRLQHKLKLLDSEKKRTVRITNQEQRMVGFSLDLIQSSSGHSPEGLAPGQVVPEEEAEEEQLFLYGDRLRSRRFGKAHKRAKSAKSALGSRRPSSAANSTGLEGLSREKQTCIPFSSPNTKPTGHKAIFLTRPDTASTGSDITSYRGDVTPLSRPSSVASTKSRPACGRSGFGYRPEATEITQWYAIDKGDVASLSRSQNHGDYGPTRSFGQNSGLSRAVSQTRLAAAAGRQSRHFTPLQAWTTTSLPLSPRQRKARQLKLNIMHEHNQLVDCRVDEFREQNPVSRYSARTVLCE